MTKSDYQIFLGLRTLKVKRLYEFAKPFIFWVGLLCLSSYLPSARAFSSEVEGKISVTKQGEVVVFLSSVVVDAIEVAKHKAFQSNISTANLTRYTVVLTEDKIRVSISPPFHGGMDGPEFYVEIRRSDLEILNYENRLGKHMQE